MANIVAFGECMVELRPLPQGRWQQGFAGDTYNTAAYIRRLDLDGMHRVEYACGLGQDPFAGQMQEAWAEEGVGSRYTRTVDGRATGLYTISVAADGERQFAYWRDTSAARSYFDVDISPLEAVAADVDVLYLSGISLGILAPAAVDRLLAVCRQVKAQGGWVVFDNNYRPRQWASPGVAWSTMRRCLATSSIALLTLEDQMALTGEPDARKALEAAWLLDVPEVAVKCGGEPTWVRDATGCHSAAVHAVKAVDTTAAGDSFAAGYIFARLGGAAPVAAAALGNALAERVVQHPGALMPKAALQADTAFWMQRQACLAAPGKQPQGL